MGVVCSKTETVVLLEVLVGSHTERKRRGWGCYRCRDKSPTIELWHMKTQTLELKMLMAQQRGSGEDDRAISIPAAIKMRHSKI